MIVFSWLGTLMKTSRIISVNSRYLLDNDREHRTIFRRVLVVVRVQLEQYLDKYNLLYGLWIRHQALQTLSCQYQSLRFVISIHNPGIIVFRQLGTLIEVSRIICRNNKYLSDGNQKLKVMTREVLIVARVWLKKNQNKYNKSYSVMIRYQT